jgi:hypothetical protein
MKTMLLGVGLGALIALMALGAPATLAQTKQTTIAPAAQANAAALRQYQWKLRTEVQRKGETKSVQVALVRFDSNGQMQTTPISKTPEPDLPKFGLRKAIAEKKYKEFKETVQQLGDLARAYSNLPPDQMQQFMTTATVTPELTAEQKLIRAEGRNVLSNGDSMTVWLDAASRKQRRVEIQTSFDGKPVRIVSEFRDLPQGGPTYLATSRIAYDDGQVGIVTENFDHERLRAETAATAPARAATPPAAPAADVSDDRWPRKFSVGGTSFAVYQPQMEQWEGNQWTGRAAFSVANTPAAQPSYGVLWFAARTEIDKVNRVVTFSDIKVTRLNFPAAPDKTSLLQSALQSHVSQKGERIALDRLLTEMAANGAGRAASGYAVKNDPPKVFFSTKPALLVLIDGAPVFRAVQGTNVERVINTRVLILRDRRNQFYLHLLDGWLQTDDLTGQWRPAAIVPSEFTKAVETAAASKQVDLLNGREEGISLADAARNNQLPEIYVSTEPAELLQTNGDPEVAAIPNTALLYVTNTENDIFVHTTTQDHYVLLAGRWFSAPSMRGPWTYVASDKLPADFARIPETHAKANVLVSVAGTPQAKEALIANSIPQTATVSRSTTTLTVSYDGTPQFKSIENTTLQYAVNTSTPVIVVNSNGYYAVYNGVWFVASSATGPWVVAATVPTVVYSIPVSSPLHYVTYVKIYGSTPEVVYVGYTPGYYGTVVTSSNVVVYGTGWYYPPYVGAYWYGAPYTYGYGVVFNWGVASGWGYAYASSYYYASGTRAAWANAYTGNVGYANAYAGTTANGTRYAARGFTNTNVYTGTTVKGGGAVAYNPNTGRIAAGQAGAATNAYTGNSAAGARGVTYNPQTGVISGGAVGGVRNGSTGAVSGGGGAFAYNPNTNNGVAVANNNVYADRNGNIYRYNQSTGVQQRTDNGWETVQRSQDRSWVQSQHQARSLGQERTQNFSSMRSNGGIQRPNFGGGGGGGFRGRRR